MRIYSCSRALLAFVEITLFWKEQKLVEYTCLQLHTVLAPHFVAQATNTDWRTLIILLHTVFLILAHIMHIITKPITPRVRASGRKENIHPASLRLSPSCFNDIAIWRPQTP